MEWEYKVLRYYHHDHYQLGLDQDLNKAGRKGWELVSSSSDNGAMFLVLKRPLDEHKTVNPAIVLKGERINI